MTGAQPDLWSAVDALIDEAASLGDLVEHRLHLLAARRWRALGRPVPPELRLAERRAVAGALAAPVLLGRIRAACDGPVVVMKGPEVAALYPDAALRPFGDIDVLVRDPAMAARALVAAGFTELGDPRLYENIHHVRPLAFKSLPLAVELHSSPKWPEGLRPPSADELLAAAVPSASGPRGVSALHPAHHALILAAHSWAHSPLRRVGELVDVDAMSEPLPASELRALAAQWGIGRLWDTTAAAASALLYGGRSTLPLRTWARHLPEVRHRTVIESHLERWLSEFWVSTTDVAASHLAGTLLREVLPARGETVRAKLARTRLAIANARLARPRHDEQVERAGVRAPLFFELDDERGDGRTGTPEERATSGSGDAGASEPDGPVDASSSA